MLKKFRNIIKCFTDFTTNIYFHKYPFFILYKPNFHLVNRSNFKEVLNDIKPGDIIIRRAKGYLSTILIPGYWSHMGIYVGGNLIINAIAKRGIVKDYLFDYLKTDSVGILRVKNKKLIPEAIEHALSLYNLAKTNNIKYDYIFETNNTNLYCSELIDICYRGLFESDYSKINKFFSKKVITPDDIYKSKNVEKIIEFKY